MMNIKDHFDKNNLHHAYLIEGRKEEILPEIFSFLEELGIKTHGNQDFQLLSYDSFKIDDARNLKSQSGEKGVSNDRRIFVISANNFLHEAQNTLLKIFEEPGKNLNFFIILPDIEVMLPTLKSRFYLIRLGSNLGKEEKEAREFTSMSLKDRIDFIKNLISENEEEEEIGNSSRAKAIKFLNALEVELHKRFFKEKDTKKEESIAFFEQILKARTYLSQPGSSTKNLMESVALIAPRF